MFLFTSPTCPHCPAAKRFIEGFVQDRKDFTLHMISTMSDQGQMLSHEFGVMSVPTFIIRGPGHEGNIGARGTPSKEMMDKYLDVAKGKLPVESLKPPGLVDSIKKIFRR